MTMIAAFPAPNLPRLPRTGAPRLETRSDIPAGAALFAGFVLARLAGRPAGPETRRTGRLVAALTRAARRQCAPALARRLTRSACADALRCEVAAAWQMPRLRRHRVMTTTPERGVAAALERIARRATADLSPADDWLHEASRFFAIGSSVPRRTRLLGLDLGRPTAGTGLDTDVSADGLVLREMIASARDGSPSVRSLIDRVTLAEPLLFEGCFARDETRWIPALRARLVETGISADQAGWLAADPPLALFLLAEAEADAGGRTLGALGSVLMAEALAAALPAPEADHEIEAAMAVVFGCRAPVDAGQLFAVLQRDDGATAAPHERPGRGRVVSGLLPNLTGGPCHA